MKLHMKILIFLVALTSVRGDCQFTKQEVEDETRLVAYEEHGKLELLHTDRVEAGRILHFICEGKSTVIVTCNRNGVFSMPLPIQNCIKKPTASVRNTNDSSCRYNAYEIGYTVGSTFLPLYTSCFDNINKNVVKTSHYAYRYSLVTTRPETSFRKDNIVNSAFAESYMAKNVYDTFNTILGQTQDYVKNKRDAIIHRGHLTPSADFLFPNYMRATFKYINVIPIFSEINRGRWKAVENFVRRFVTRTGKAKIVTGGLQILALPDDHLTFKDMFLYRPSYNKIPKWIFKFVQHENERYVFLTYNNIELDMRPQPDCLETQCPPDLRNENGFGLTYCCDPDHFQRHVMP